MSHPLANKFCSLGFVTNVPRPAETGANQQFEKLIVVLKGPRVFLGAPQSDSGEPQITEMVDVAPRVTVAVGECGPQELRIIGVHASEVVLEVLAEMPRKIW